MKSHSQKTRFLSTATIVTVAMSLAACGSSIGDGVDAPHVDVLDRQELLVGQPLRFFGRNFLTPEEGYTRVEFHGVYYTEGSASRTPHSASFRVAANFEATYENGVEIDGVDLGENTQALKLNRFGPFQMPFNSDVKQPGTFEGTLRAVNIDHDGNEEEDPFPSFVTLSVQPSIVINVLAPVTGENAVGNQEVAPCKAPALRVFGGVPYVMEVEAIGFTPVRFSYAINEGPAGYQTFNHAASGQVDRVGDASWTATETLKFAELSDTEETGTVTITISATDTAGQLHSSVLPIPLVRMMQMYSDGQLRLAEYYQPEVVNGPIVGALGTSVSYSESRSESRQQGVSVGISKSFSESNGTSSDSNWSEGISVSESTDTSKSTSLGYSEGESSGESYGVDYGSSTSTSNGGSSSDGTTWTMGGDLGLGKILSIPGLGASMGYSRNESESTTWDTTTSDSKGESWGQTYGVNSQHSIGESTSESEGHSESTTYNMGGSEGVSQNFTVGDSESWGETWSKSEDWSSSLSYSSRVPNGRCAMVYRQTVRYVREAVLYAHDMCGVRSTVGKMTFNEFKWSPNIAIGTDCNDLPSTQPKAECFLACD